MNIDLSRSGYDPSSNSPISGRRIMIVEDEEGLAMHMAFLLKRLNYEPLDTTAYGEQAVELAGKLCPDLVLMDINLAGPMNGIEAARLIHERYDIPVIYLSALTEQMTFQEAQGSQPYAFLVKPVKEPDLRAAIEIALYKHQMEIRLRDSEDRYRVLFERMTNGFGLGEVVCGSDGCPIDYRFLALNPAFEQMTGVKAKDLLGHSLRESLPQFDGEVLIENFGRVALTGESVHFEFHLNSRNRDFQITAYSPRPGQFATIVEDITEQRRAEQSLKQNLRRMMALRNIDQAITTHADQTGMAGAILADMVDSGEIDAAVLFVPNVPAPGRVRGTGPLGMLRLGAEPVGLPESVIDSSVTNWQTMMANNVYHSGQPIFISDLCEDTHPGAQALHRSAGFNACAVLPLVARGKMRGVLQFLQQQSIVPDAEWQTFLQSLAMQTAIGIDNVENLENLKRSNRELALAYDETIKGWAMALELRDKETRGHCQRVSEQTVRLAIALGISGESLDHIRRGAFLHDIGKMAVPDSILGKTGPLNSEEWITMRQHPMKGYSLIANIEYLKPALDVVLCHHEKWDGSGYPRGLKGEEIPLSARIFAVVDVWDALTSDRPYRLAWPEADVRAYLQSQVGKHFDPRIVDEFLKIM